MVTLLSRDGRQGTYRCECGKVFVASIYHVRNGNTKSCGCLKRRLCAEIHITHGHSSGGRSTKVYRAWKHMKARCNNKNQPHYHYHGGRGIDYALEWEQFDNFFRDMGHPPSPKSTLERLDNDKGYSKGNCAWVTQAVQNRNKRNNVLYAYKGRSKSLADWAIETGIPERSLRMRIWRGWPVERALTEPTSYGETFQWDGQSHTLQEWAVITGQHLRTLRKRIQLGWPIEKVLTVPPYSGNRIVRTLARG